MTTNMTRRDFETFDKNDPLAHWRGEFSLPKDTIYLDGNSLGVLPRATLARMQDVITREWGQDLIRSWNSADWFNAPVRIGDKIARLVGAEAGEVVAADSTSVNLFKLAASAVRMRPQRFKIITEPGNFPTDLYILQGLVDYLGPDYVLVPTEREKIADAIDQETAVVILTHVHYKTGEMFDMASLTRRAHQQGALILWDLSHSAGALAVDLNGCDADFAIGCGYKYLNGGPGAPAFLFVAERHQMDVHPPLSGWMGHAAPFAFVDEYTPDPGIRRNLCGTPSILGLAALEVSLDLWTAVDMKEVRQKSRKMGDLFIRLTEEKCGGHGFGLASPKDSAIRGSQVSLTHKHGYAIMQALIAHKVIGDFRAPDILRFGFTPLYLRYTDIWDAVETLQKIMKSDAWTAAEFSKLTAVT
jgi:kynureninase